MEEARRFVLQFHELREILRPTKKKKKRTKRRKTRRGREEEKRVAVLVAVVGKKTLDRRCPPGEKKNLSFVLRFFSPNSCFCLLTRWQGRSKSCQLGRKTERASGRKAANFFFSSLPPSSYQDERAVQEEEQRTKSDASPVMKSGVRGFVVVDVGR